MKEIVEPEAMESATEPEGFANRKLIRPVLHRPENGQHNSVHAPNHGNHAPTHHAGPSHGGGQNHATHHVSNQGHGSHGHGPQNHGASNHGVSNHGSGGGDRRPAGGNSKKTPPAETTHAENFYYQKQMQSKTPMVIVLRDGEEIRGTIEWYDKSCLKINRDGDPNLLLYKSNIKYMYKDE